MRAFREEYYEFSHYILCNYMKRLNIAPNDVYAPFNPLIKQPPIICQSDNTGEGDYVIWVHPCLLREIPLCRNRMKILYSQKLFKASSRPRLAGLLFGSPMQRLRHQKEALVGPLSWPYASCRIDSSWPSEAHRFFL